jgi:capsule polysaccharide export protein KpsE/RkpR
MPKKKKKKKKKKNPLSWTEIILVTRYFVLFRENCYSSSQSDLIDRLKSMVAKCPKYEHSLLLSKLRQNNTFTNYSRKS